MTSRPRLVLSLVCVAAFLVYLDTSITPVAIPAINADLGAGATAAQWLLDAYTLAFACLLLTAGSLGDRIGRKTMLLIGTAGFTVASVGCAAAPDIGFLIAARGLQGVCAAAVVPLSLAVTSGLFTGVKARATAIGVWGGTSGVALALGPLLGGLLVQAWGWRSMFWINLPIGLIAFTGLLWTMAFATPSGGKRPDLLGQTLFVAGGFAVTFALIEGHTYGWGPMGALAAAGVVALVMFVWWELRAREPMLPPRLLRIPAVAVACAVNFLGLFGLYAVLYLVTVYLQDVVGLSALGTGLRFLALFGFLGVTAICASAVVARLGTRNTMIGGLVCIAVGLVGLTLLETGVGYFGYGWAFVLLGVGIPLSGGVVAIQAMMGAVPPELGGTASGTMNTFRQFGAVFGVALAGILPSATVTFVVAAAGAVFAVVAVLASRRERAAEAPVVATTPTR
ncbi:MFS transporter [Amycolatopsis sp. K13G38]|uniref:MFS transporter n=1 Tax=Amycolatopsis acididurans TaxID=2724524 RepID=A0ABX1JI89_9PSEU|nr:MFS transporter [Amycolatopsis acididurans]NKQ58321.1 MFS transporter [Amycolatopsis acididurans]